jgi:ABC-type bacteriocin/lantibiotic exporter with double-glycine peptidase domain
MICAENVSKYGFPIHRQERDMSCGPACLLMLAEWATGQPQSEYHWRQLSGWSDGLKIEKMTLALAHLPGLLSPAQPLT